MIVAVAMWACRPGCRNGVTDIAATLRQSFRERVVGESAALATIVQAAGPGLRLVVWGEPGTGKSLIAELVASSFFRADRPYPTQCGVSWWRGSVEASGDPRTVFVLEDVAQPPDLDALAVVVTAAKPVDGWTNVELKGLSAPQVEELVDKYAQRDATRAVREALLFYSVRWEGTVVFDAALRAELKRRVLTDERGHALPRFHATHVEPALLDAIALLLPTPPPRRPWTRTTLDGDLVLSHELTWSKRV